MKNPTKQTCLDCHFLCQAQDFSHNSRNPKHYVFPRERREALRKRIAAGHTSIDDNPTLACDWGEWREYDYDVQPNRLDELTKNRANLCFFSTYQPGQSLQAAKIKQQRTEDREKLLESRRLSTIAIFIAAIGLFLNLGQLIIRITEFVRSVVGTNPTPPPYP